MKIISLGYACQVKHHIDNYNISEYNKTDMTNFFDWLITDFRTVLYVLKALCDNNLDFLSFNKFTDKWIYMQCNSWHPPCHKVEHTDIKMISIHEFPVDVPYYTCVLDYISTYKRRLLRLKEYIMSNETIHFIHMIDHTLTEEYIPTEIDITIFCEYIYKINRNCRFYLHIAMSPSSNNFNQLLSQNNDINIFKYRLEKTHDMEVNWENNDYNWEIIFNKIKKLT